MYLYVPRPNMDWAGLSHAGIYIGEGKFVHAEWYGVGVMTSFTNDPRNGNYWAAHFVTGVRAWAAR